MIERGPYRLPAVLEEELTRRGISNRELARMTDQVWNGDGITYSLVTKILNKQTEPRNETLLKIAATLAAHPIAGGPQTTKGYFSLLLEAAGYPVDTTAASDEERTAKITQLLRNSADPDGLAAKLEQIDPAVLGQVVDRLGTPAPAAGSGGGAHSRPALRSRPGAARPRPGKR